MKGMLLDSPGKVSGTVYSLCKESITTIGFLVYRPNGQYYEITGNHVGRVFDFEDPWYAFDYDKMESMINDGDCSISMILKHKNQNHFRWNFTIKPVSTEYVQSY